MPPLYKIVIPETDTVIINPDAHPEVSSVDGYVRHVNWGGMDWADLIAAAGNYADDDGTGTTPGMYSNNVQDKWALLDRVIFLFDASAYIGKKAQSAYIELYLAPGVDNLNINPNFNIYTSNPASDTALVAGDFATFGSTPLSDSLAYTDVPIGWHKFHLNATGLAKLQAALNGDGIFRAGLRNANYDAAGVEPAWSLQDQSYIDVDMAESVNKPRLVMTYVI